MTPRINICIPSMDMVHADFAMALAGLAYSCGPMIYKTRDGGTEEFPPLSIQLTNSKGSLVMVSRNKLVKEAQKQGDVTHILFLDSDIIMPAWTLRRLLKCDKDIVGATYMKRDGPEMMLGKAQGKLLHDVMRQQAVNTGELMEMDGLPTGCLLIKLSVFEQMRRPYFRTPAFEEDPEIPDSDWIQGEDYYFCEVARKLGLKIWLDWGLSFELAHIGQKLNKIPTMQIGESANGIIH